MADVLIKTSTFHSAFPLSDNFLKSKKLETQNCVLSVVSKSCKFKGFPLKAEPILASWRSQDEWVGSGFYGKRDVVSQGDESGRPRSCLSMKAQAGGFRIGSAQRWWEKELQPNMKEVVSAQDLVNSLTNAGDKLVVVDFFSPGCGGCKALHPKICQLAGMNPDVQILQVNYEEHKSMCYSLNVHVLPFFRFYRGAHGRLCSFSCTNATIKKFKDALAKHTPDRCSLGPTKGLEEKELIALASNRDLSFNYTPTPIQPEPSPAKEQSAPHSPSHPNPILVPLLAMETIKSAEEDRTLVASGR